MTPVVNIIPLFVAFPLGGAFLTSMFGKRVKWLPDILGNLTTFVLLGLSIFAVRAVDVHGVLVYKVGVWRPPIGISMVLDNLSSFTITAM